MNLKNKFSKQIFLVVLGVVLFWGLFNYKLVLGAVGWCIDMLKPFILGAVIAFILNVPMSGIEKRFYKEPKNVKFKKIAEKLKRPVSILSFQKLLHEENTNKILKIKYIFFILFPTC